MSDITGAICSHDVMLPYYQLGEFNLYKIHYKCTHCDFETDEEPPTTKGVESNV